MAMPNHNSDSQTDLKCKPTAPKSVGPKPGGPGDIVTLDQLRKLPYGALITYTQDNGKTWEHAEVQAFNPEINGITGPIRGVQTRLRAPSSRAGLFIVLTDHMFEDGLVARRVEAAKE